MSSPFDLTGKKALVTGGSRGIGRGLAEGLLEVGAEVVISGVSERVYTTAEELTVATGRPAIPIRADLAVRDEIERLFAESLDKLGTVDILVANHGVQRRHPAHEFPAESMDAVIDVNLKSVFLLNQLAARHMLAKGFGRIINIASMMSYAGGLHIPAYAASKGGIVQMVKSFSNEWAAHGVTVNAIAPGYIKTDMTQDLVNDTERYRMILDRIPAGRWGTADDLKGIVVFLASDAAKFVSGTTIPVDGGWLGR